MIFTILDQVKQASRKTLLRDVLAGLTVAIIVIPQGMAYAVLGGLPPVYGLYASLVPLFIYPLFASSRQLSVGPVALLSIITIDGLSKFAVPGSDEFIQLALLTALIAGMIQIVLSALRLGVLVNFLSEPVIRGFTTAAALIIGVGQLQHILGLQAIRSNSILDILRSISVSFGKIEFLPLAVGLLGIGLILGLKKIWRSFPGAVVVVILSISAVAIFNLESKGLAVIGDVPKGLPSFHMLTLSWETVLNILPLAAVICIISFIESLSISKSIATKHENYPINSNKELFALGISKVVGSFFGSYPTSGSFTRSAINSDLGAGTGLASIVAGVLVTVALLFLTPVFAFIPKAILAAIIIVAMIGLLNFREIRNIFHLDKKDFYVFLATFLLTLLVGVQKGILIGVGVSIAFILIKTSRPHFAILGRLEGTQVYRNIRRYPNAIINPQFLIIRYDVDIYFGNAEHFYDTLLSELRKAKEAKYLILNMAGIGTIDTTGLYKFKLLIDALDEVEVKLLTAGMRGQVRDLFVKADLMKRIGEENNYLTIHHAVEGAEFHDEDGLSQRYASQHN